MPSHIGGRFGSVGKESCTKLSMTPNQVCPVASPLPEGESGLERIVTEMEKRARSGHVAGPPVASESGRSGGKNTPMVPSRQHVLIRVGASRNEWARGL